MSPISAFGGVCLYVFRPKGESPDHGYHPTGRSPQTLPHFPWTKAPGHENELCESRYRRCILQMLSQNIGQCWPGRKSSLPPPSSDEIFSQGLCGRSHKTSSTFPCMWKKALFLMRSPSLPWRDSPRDREKFSSITENVPSWNLTFLATLCPRCGWNLEGEKDSVVLTCGNCQTAWEAQRGQFVPIRFSRGPGPSAGYFISPFLANVCSSRRGHH